MRRSAAPSTLPAAKKPRFQPPFNVAKTSPVQRVPFTTSDKQNQEEEVQVKDGVKQTSNLLSVLNEIRKPFHPQCTDPVFTEEQHQSTNESSPSPSTNANQVIQCSEAQQVTKQNITSRISSVNRECSLSYSEQSTSTSITMRKTIQKTSFKCQSSNHSASKDTQQADCETITTNRTTPSSNSSASDTKYYNVMWCKMSKKKHKTWEEDAILIVHKTSVTLKDMEGKDIGRATGYRVSELSGLSEGSTLIVGGKEVEVLSEISADQWKSGRCFTGASSDTSSTQTTMPISSKATTKKFVNPLLSSSTAPRPLHKERPVVIKPLFDPFSPDALVMPRPHAKHQMAHNRSGLQVVDVVVDPHLSYHLRPHQRDGVLFLYECVMGMREFNGHGAILADEMGLGKTLQCITVLWTLLKQGPYGRTPIVKKALIVTPGSLVQNWEREFRKWLGNERLHVFSASSDNRAVEFLKSPVYPVLIISYEMLLRSQEEISRVKFDLVICDEGHRLKNSGAKTTVMLMGLPTHRRIVLTGTPIQNDLQEFYSIVEFCNPGVLGSPSAFQKVYEQPIVLSQQPEATRVEKEIGEMRGRELKRLTSLFCIRRTQEVNKKYLPPKVESVVFCRMSPLQLSVYKHLLNSQLVRSCLRRDTDSSPHLECIGALRKVCNSPALILPAARAVEKSHSRGKERFMESNSSLYDGVLDLFTNECESTSAEHAGKLSVLSKMLNQLHSTTREKIVLVSNFTQMLDILQSLCEDCGYKYLRLDGSTPSTKRQSLVERFNNKHSKETVFLLSSKAGGVGLNLVGASRLVLYDVDWNPANDLQAMARVWRDGQRKRVHIYRLLTTGTIEEKIYQRQISKQGLSSVVDFENGVGNSGAVKFSLEDLKDLFTLHDTTLCDTHDLMDCKCSTEPVQRGGIVENYSKKQKPLLTELGAWRHFKEPINNTALGDDLLLQACSDVTFVFETETTL